MITSGISSVNIWCTWQENKRKKAEICENILFNILSVPEEQIFQINKARKQNSFWDWFKNFRKTGKMGKQPENLDMNLNFTMSEVNESMMNPSAYGGSIIGGEDNLNNNKIGENKKGKVIKKGKLNKGRNLIVNVI